MRRAIVTKMNHHSNELLNYYFTQFDDQLRQKIFDSYKKKIVKINCPNRYFGDKRY